jgi:hypothetical protein
VEELLVVGQGDLHRTPSLVASGRTAVIVPPFLGVAQSRGQDMSLAIEATQSGDEQRTT